MFNSESLGINHFWAKLAVEELVRLGVRDFCVSPGSRSGPLALALGENQDCNVTVHFDERGAGFFALGQASALQKPVALLCTSGTAVANYLPAVIEASQSCTPLIILSCDRPIELQDSAANQTIKQDDIFGEFVRWRFSLSAPQADIDAGLVLSLIDQAVFRSASDPTGPVHLNFAFRKPLLSEEQENFKLSPALQEWASSKGPYTRYVRPEIDLLLQDIKTFADLAEQSKAGVIVASQLKNEEDKQAVLKLSRILNWPLIADVTSGLRFCSAQSSDNVVSHFGFYLAQKDAQEEFKSDFVFHFGGAPVSSALESYLSRHTGNYVLVNSQPSRMEPGARVTHRVQSRIAAFAEKLAEHCKPVESRLKRRFAVSEECPQGVLEETRVKQSQLSEIFAVDLAARISPSGSAIYLGNSLPIRYADLILENSGKDILIGYHRGVSGIDGTLACAAGFAKASKRATTVVLGDLACLHDLNSLALCRQTELPFVILAINNDGGGIFNFLPVLPKLEIFEKYFAGQHGFNFAAAAQMFGLEYFNARDMRELGEAYHRAINSNRAALIEIRTDRKSNTKMQNRLEQQISRQVFPEIDYEQS